MRVLFLRFIIIHVLVECFPQRESDPSFTSVAPGTAGDLKNIFNNPVEPSVREIQNNIQSSNGGAETPIEIISKDGDLENSEALKKVAPNPSTVSNSNFLDQGISLAPLNLGESTPDGSESLDEPNPNSNDQSLAASSSNLIDQGVKTASPDNEQMTGLQSAGQSGPSSDDQGITVTASNSDISTTNDKNPVAEPDSNPDDHGINPTIAVSGTSSAGDSANSINTLGTLIALGSGNNPGPSGDKPGYTSPASDDDDSHPSCRGRRNFHCCYHQRKTLFCRALTSSSQWCIGSDFQMCCLRTTTPRIKRKKKYKYGVGIGCEPVKWSHEQQTPLGATDDVWAGLIGRTWDIGIKPLYKDFVHPELLKVGKAVDRLVNTVNKKAVNPVLSTATEKIQWLQENCPLQNYEMVGFNENKCVSKLVQYLQGLTGRPR